MKRKFLKSILILFTLNCATVFASENRTFNFSWLTDGLIAGSAFALDLTDVILNRVCDFGDVDYEGQTFDSSLVNSFDRSMMHSYVKGADTAADIITVATALTPAIMFSCPRSSWVTIYVMYAESLMWAYGIKEILKMSVGRVRPYMYFDDYPVYEVLKGDWNTSFPSGHTTYAFTAATFSTYIFCTYYPNSAWRFAVGFGSYALAATTAFLRVYSGCHFVTDVLTGMGIGTLCGFIVPFLHTLVDADDDDNEFASASSNSNKNGGIRIAQNMSVRISPLCLDFITCW